MRGLIEREIMCRIVVGQKRRPASPSCGLQSNLFSVFEEDSSPVIRHFFGYTHFNMRNLDFAIYSVHAMFWAAFMLTRSTVHRRDGSLGISKEAETIPERQETTVPYSRALVVFHALAFAVMYVGIAIAVFPHRVPVWFTGQSLVGALIIAASAALVIWALVHLRSWRFRAAVDADHQLATSGPFRLLRHPIYMGLNLLALGTAVWTPTPMVWIAFLLMIIGGDLRARAEETLLIKAYGPTYREYCSRTRRFVPGIY